MELTQGELAAAIVNYRDSSFSNGNVHFISYNSSSALARDLLLAVQNAQRKREEEKAMSSTAALAAAFHADDPAYTEVEIGKALVDYGYGAVHADSFAKTLAIYAQRRRDAAKEPAWKPGDVVKTAKGKVLVRTSVNSWYRAEDGLYFSDSKVTRPLTILHKGA